jgi:hypothetical protein
MRRLRDRTPAPFFRGSELPRMITLVLMLGVLVLLIDIARKPATWTWLAPNDREARQAGEEKSHPASGRESRVAAWDPEAAGPTDLDPLEQDAAREEFQAITDKTPLAPDEMPAYWRLMAWERHQSTDALLKRAVSNVTYNDLWQRPAEWRGKLVQLRVHLRQAIALQDLPDNPLDVKSLYEVTGWTSDSWNWYWMIVPQLPPGMPLGADIYEEATFVGYFLKLQPYEDRQGKSRAMPVLIGRLIWHPSQGEIVARGDQWAWTWYLGGALVALFVVRWTLAVVVRRRRVSADVRAGADPRAVEAWLDRAETSADDDETEPSNDGNRTRGAPWEMTGPPPDDE